MESAGLTARVPEREEIVGAAFVQVSDVRALDVDSIGSGEVCVVDLVKPVGFHDRLSGHGSCSS
jgi:hypothetical protein